MLAILSLNLGVTLFTALVTLRDFPNSGDEYAYLLSAQLFSEGRLWVPSPEPREFFAVTHVINDGHYYGKYPPGWPLILSVGMLLNAPWLVNPLLGMLTLLLIHRMALENFSRESANAALYAAAANPFLIFNSASYFSHPSCLLFLALFAHSALRCLRQPGVRVPYLVMGASLGVAFLIRPYTSVALALPFGAYLLINSFRRRQFPLLWKGLLLSAIPFTILFIVLLIYNDLQTGHPLRQPFSAYNPSDRPFAIHWDRFFYYKWYRPLKELNLWIPLALPLVVLGFVPRETRRNARALLLLSGFVSLFIAYVVFPGSGGNRYGPRYLYEASFAVFILIGCAIVPWKRVAAPMLLVLVCLNVYWFVTRTTLHAAQVRERMNVYDMVKQQQITNAMVFLHTGSGSMGPWDLARNGIHFDGPVLYVRDRGDRNADLLRAFPGRHAYVYRYERRTGTGTLTPYGPD